MGLPALTSTKYVIRGNGQIIIKDTQLAWVSFIIKINYHTNSPTSIALNKETAIPLTRSFQTFLPMTDDFLRQIMNCKFRKSYLLY